MIRKVLLASFCMFSAAVMAQVWKYVDPRIGSVGVGRTFPGPCMPFGMVKPGPDCGVLPNAGWAQMPEPVLGFSQTHVSGTGGGQKYGNILIQPYLVADSSAMAPARAAYPWPAYPQHRMSETIELGYYSTTFSNGIRTEITTAPRCSFYRIHYPSSGGSLFVDVTHFLGKDTVPNLRERQQFVGSDFRIVDRHEVCGQSSVRGGWNNGDAYTVYFSLVSDVPFEAEGCRLHFRSPLVNVKVGISYVSVEQARRNIPTCGFDAQLSSLRQAWEEQLSKIQIEGTTEQRHMFYTALYHTMLMPVDKTGENPKNAHQQSPYYDDYYAIWDTYRTSSTLLTLICPDRQVDIINSLLNIYQQDGYMPDARSGDCNGRTQGGSNAEVVVADAFLKGLQGIDYPLALKAMIHDAEADPGTDHEKHGRGGLTLYNERGYIPYGIPRAGTRTVEYALNDYCIAQVARGLNKPDLYKKYMKRSQNWKNLWRTDFEWDGMRGFILPRDANGQWMDAVPWGESKVYHPVIPYTPVTKVAPWYLPWWSTFFYEATSEEYSLSVPHDVPGLIRACGGKRKFRERLDLFFEKGYYNVQNEPSFLTPCLYHWIGRPDLSTQRIHQIVRDHYSDAPDGLPGNDDSGAMSSWLAFHMMGLYPNAGHDYYLLNLPLLPGYTFRLANGRSLRVTVQDEEGHALADSLLSPFTQRPTQFQVSFNGRRLNDFRLRHALLMEGGELMFTVTEKGSGAPISKAAPVVSAEPLAQPTPFLQGTVSFTLNRQFRTWPVAMGWSGDTLVVGCRQGSYLIPAPALASANQFCWLMPTDGQQHRVADATFLFISQKALETLRRTGSFVYDGITWRLVDEDAASLRVRADVDATVMRISKNTPLPLVVEMQGNPLGIDWRLSLHPAP